PDALRADETARALLTGKPGGADHAGFALRAGCAFGALGADGTLRAGRALGADGTLRATGTLGPLVAPLTDGAGRPGRALVAPLAHGARRAGRALVALVPAGANRPGRARRALRAGDRVERWGHDGRLDLFDL